MSLSYIRRYYGVPAKKEVRVKFTEEGDLCGEMGTIVGSSCPYLSVRFDCLAGKPTVRVHPKSVVYETEETKPESQDG